MTEQDTRFDYGESRFITLGLLTTQLVVLVWTTTRRFLPHYFDEVCQ